MTSAASLLQAATGQPAGNGGAPAGERSLEDVLRIADDQTKAKILVALRALAEFEERRQGERA